MNENIKSCDLFDMPERKVMNKSKIGDLIDDVLRKHDIMDMVAWVDVDTKGYSAYIEIYPEDEFSIKFDLLYDLSQVLKTKMIDFRSKHNPGYRYSSYTWEGSKTELCIEITEIGSLDNGTE